MYRHDPLMRSLLSQFRTPTTPRRAVGFFRSGRLAGCPARLITQSTLDWLSIIVPTLSTVDASKVTRVMKKVNANYWCNGEVLSCEYRMSQISVQQKLIHRYREL